PRRGGHRREQHHARDRPRADGRVRHPARDRCDTLLGHAPGRRGGPAADPGRGLRRPARGDGARGPRRAPHGGKRDVDVQPAQRQPRERARRTRDPGPRRRPRRGDPGPARGAYQPGRGVEDGSMKKVFAVLFGLVALSALAGTMFYLYSKSETTPVTYKTETPAVKTIIKKTVATGSVVPRKEVAVKPQVSGIIDKLHVEPGQSIKEGDLIAR